MIVNGCSRVTARARSSSSAASRARPRSRSASMVSTPASSSPAGSITITVSSAGRFARTRSIFATCVASSQTIARAPELPATHSHSSGEFVG